MKKLISLILAGMLALAACSALAEVVSIVDTPFMLDIPDVMEECELTDEDIEEGMIAALVNTDETLEMCVYIYDSEDFTLEEIEAELKEDMPDAEIGYTEINGITVLFAAFTEDGENCICYFAIEESVEIDVVFFFTEDAAGMLSGEIMGSLSK